MIESVTMRMHGHAAHDTAWYVPKKMLEEGKKKDPIDRFEKLLIAEGALTAAKKKEMTGVIQAMLEEAVAIALEASYPPGEQAAEDVYAS